MKLTTKMILVVLFFCLLQPFTAMAGVSVVGSLFRKKNVTPGGTFQGIIFIRNKTDAPREVKVYQTDYLFFFDGRNIYGEPGKDPRSNANWISFSPQRLVIPPKGKSEVNYTVKVPDDETFVGTYWSMLMVERISKNSPEVIGLDKGKINLGMRQVIRWGIQVVTHIGDTGVRKIKFLKIKLMKMKEKKILLIDIENIGDRLLNPVLWNELYDEKGGFIGRLKGGKWSIYPGTSVRYRVDISTVPKGKYKALIVADNGDEHVFGARYILNL